MQIFSIKSLLAITFLLTTVLTSSSAAFAAPKIEWTPGEIQFTFGSGQGPGNPVFATFTSNTPLDQITLEVVPSLSDFVVVEPAAIQNVQAGVPYTIALHFSLPPGVEPGTYEGVLHVRSGRRVVAQPLKITITVEPQILLGTDLPTTNSDFEAAVTFLQTLAQKFTLTSLVNIGTIKLQMSGFGVDQFTVWVTNSIGPGTTQANVLFQTNLTFPNTGGAIRGTTLSVPVDLSLPPGDYFIVLGSTQSNVLQGWIMSNTILPSTVGSVGGWEFTLTGNSNPAFPPSSIFTPVGIRPGAFQLLQ